MGLFFPYPRQAASCSPGSEELCVEPLRPETPRITGPFVLVGVDEGRRESKCPVDGVSRRGERLEVRERGEFAGHGRTLYSRGLKNGGAAQTSWTTPPGADPTRGDEGLRADV